MEGRPDQVPILYRRASERYEHNGSSADAIRHALAAEDFTYKLRRIYGVQQ